jgi:hypothetical protein
MGFRKGGCVFALAIGAPGAAAADGSVGQQKITGGGPISIAQVPWQVALADSQSFSPVKRRR